jgi:CubicO group peptidase (beta-lactamase class C family)
MSGNIRAAALVGLAVWTGSLFGNPVRAADWTDVGAASKPPWVDAAAERRLRLLPALPGIADNLNSLVNGYFGTKGPGLAVGLVLDDGLYYSQGFGFADAQKTRAPDETTIFRAGSLSKVITGAGLLTLIDASTGRSKMTLDDAADQNRYLPELKFVCPQFNQPCNRGSQNLGIKLKHLVSHTAGLPNVMEQTNAGVDAWLVDLKKSWLIFQPGAFSAYSGVAVEGVGLIEQRVSGEKYVDFINHHLFAPLGMTSSSMDETQLPQQRRAQKWLFQSGVNDACGLGCNTAECMAAAHGAPQKQQCVKEKQECAKACPPAQTVFSFSPYNQIIAGDDQPMIAPAGGLATSVEDLSRFMQMWISKEAPKAKGKPLLTESTINAASQSLFSSTASPLGVANCNGIKDMNTPPFSYSGCGTAFGFGVNWYAGTSPYIEHNGDEPGLSGSNTRIDQSHKMGATGLVSTEPYPSASNAFIDKVVYGMLDSTLSGDAATNWSGKTLSDGVARVLFLSGKTPQSGDLDAFAPDFVAAHQLTASNVVAFLTTWHNQVGSCPTFRVRAVQTADKIELRLPCKKASWDIVLTVEDKSPHRIAWSEVSSVPVAGGGSPSSKGQCLMACTTDQGKCMAQAHGSSEKQACVQEKKACMAQCK